MKEPKIIWMLPLLGAIGFGIAFALMSAIMLTIYHTSIISIARDFNEPLNFRIIGLGATRGIFVGSMGGAALGLALKDKTLAYRLSLAGAIGFGWAFVIVISRGDIMWDIGSKIANIMEESGSFLSSEAHGLGIGSVVGGIGGLVLGLALPKYRAISALLLCLAGIVSFSLVFAVGDYLFEGYFYTSWNAWGGIVGGASLGMALTLYFIILGYVRHRQR